MKRWIKILTHFIRSLTKTQSEDKVKKSLSTLIGKYENQLKFIRSLQCNSHVGLTNDELGNALIPEDLPSSTDKRIYKAVKTTGNGDCLYNAVSLALVGNYNELYAILLRLLVALELALNIDFYAQHPKFVSFPSVVSAHAVQFNIITSKRYVNWLYQYDLISWFS